MTRSINGRYGWELRCVTCVKKEVDIADLGICFPLSVRLFFSYCVILLLLLLCLACFNISFVFSVQHFFLRDSQMNGLNCAQNMT